MYIYIDVQISESTYVFTFNYSVYLTVPYIKV